jgi:hypothetical protein
MVEPVLPILAIRGRWKQPTGHVHADAEHNTKRDEKREDLFRSYAANSPDCAGNTR